MPYAEHYSLPTSTPAKMSPTTLCALVCALLGASLCAKVPVRAPAPVTSDDCACQCDSTTYLDEEHIVQGNCRAADTTGRRWCYVSADQGTMEACKDTFDFDPRYNMSRSYAACSSPDPDSHLCAWQDTYDSTY